MLHLETLSDDWRALAAKYHLDLPELQRINNSTIRHNWAARQRGGAADALKHLTVTNYTGWQRVACEQLRSLPAKLAELAANAMTKVRKTRHSNNYE